MASNRSQGKQTILTRKTGLTSSEFCFRVNFPTVPQISLFPEKHIHETVHDQQNCAQFNQHNLHRLISNARTIRTKLQKLSTICLQKDLLKSAHNVVCFHAWVNIVQWPTLRHLFQLCGAVWKLQEASFAPAFCQHTTFALWGKKCHHPNVVHGCRCTLVFPHTIGATAQWNKNMCPFATREENVIRHHAGKFFCHVKKQSFSKLQIWISIPHGGSRILALVRDRNAASSACGSSNSNLNPSETL